MMRVYLPLLATAQGSVVRVPHSCGWMEMLACLVVLKGMAVVRAGEEGWSVAVMVEAWAREQIREGRAAPTV